MRGTGVQLRRARDAGEFTDRMRRLKERSGLTYRELEQRAQDRGEVLPRSTLSDVLQRRSLPRPELLIAFLHVCGVEDEREIESWLETRIRIEGTSGNRRRFRSKPLAAAVIAVLLLAVGLLAAGVWTLLPDDGDGDGEARTPAAPAVRGWVEIRPARTPDLCLTEGRDRSGAYANAIAAQRPCKEAKPPHTYLKPVHDGPDAPHYIEWHHPAHGTGCLTIRRSAPAKGMLEPWDACSRSNKDQHFHVEPAGAESRYRLRAEATSQCIGITDGDTRPEAEAVEKPCTDGPDQQFLIENVA
ncbi:helix-turn-helix domain-containing protein [Streptomyces roseoverticillatus]|uniref:helix-turn-helix domain-containing protein n=1 Tax=Streptomyces roseoverticillatus TaxID=66429 RepID=UPI001F3D5797|nr:helix-turn-helix domain-containing protein [Streptomyces roseoverticillatus]MCF3102383.1 helix-turn-helix domain-containing protein [Streptomyces roseoverticillatus]